MSEISSLSLLVGTSDCNAYCAHCAGLPLRKYAPRKDGVINTELIRKVLKDCYAMGARRLSISSCGEPTLSPQSMVKTMELVKACCDSGCPYRPINMYSNGILIGEGKVTKLLGQLRDLGLSGINLTLHNLDSRVNARVYKVGSYPELSDIVGNIHGAGLNTRANVILGKSSVATFDSFRALVVSLWGLGVGAIHAWPLKDSQENIDPAYLPGKEELEKISEWVRSNDPKRTIQLQLPGEETIGNGRKLTLFPNDQLSDAWCNAK